MTDLALPAQERFSAKRVRLRERALASDLVQWIVPLGLLAIWQALSRAGVIPPTILPAPSDVLAAGWRMTLTGELPGHIAVSFRRAISGFLLGVIREDERAPDYVI